jgi:hypothetical protein
MSSPRESEVRVTVLPLRETLASASANAGNASIARTTVAQSPK